MSSVNMSYFSFKCILTFLYCDALNLEELNSLDYKFSVNVLPGRNFILKQKSHCVTGDW